MAGWRPARLMRRFGRDRSGVAAVEFALISPLFFFVIFAAIESSLYMGGGVLLDHAVHTAARKVFTGQTQTADTAPDAFRKSICDQVSFFLSCNNLKIDMRTYKTFDKVDVNIPSKLGKLDDTGFCFDPGAQGEITVVRAFYHWPWIMGELSRVANPNGEQTLLFSMAAFMNEPFGTAKSTKATCS